MRKSLASEASCKSETTLIQDLPSVTQTTNFGHDFSEGCNGEKGQEFTESKNIPRGVIRRSLDEKILRKCSEKFGETIWRAEMPAEAANLDEDGLYSTYIFCTQQIRKPTTTLRTKALLDRTKVLCAMAIDQPTETSLGVVSTLFTLYNSEAFKYKDNTPREFYLSRNVSDLEERLRKTEKAWLLTSYGDYIASYLTDLRSKAKDPLGSGKLSEETRRILTPTVYWTVVNNE